MLVGPSMPMSSAAARPPPDPNPRAFPRWRPRLSPRSARKVDALDHRSDPRTLDNDAGDASSDTGQMSFAPSIRRFQLELLSSSHGVRHCRSADRCVRTTERHTRSNESAPHELHDAALEPADVYRLLEPFRNT
jgi:hypothetical protein